MKKNYPKDIVTKDRKGNITEYKPNEKQIYSLCRSCGKKGIHACEILDATETAYVLDEQRNERCYHCDSLFIDDIFTIILSIKMRFIVNVVNEYR